MGRHNQLALMDDIFGGSIGFPFEPIRTPFFRNVRTEMPLADLFRGGDITRKEDGSTVIKMNFAGHNKEDINIDLDEETHSLEASVNIKDDEENYTRTSYRYRVSADVKADDISAKYENGLLIVTIAPAEGEEPKEKVKISVT